MIDDNFLNEKIKERIEKIKLEQLRPLIATILGERFKLKLAEDIVTSVIRDYEKNKIEQTGQYSVFSSFFNIKSEKDGESYYKISLDTFKTEDSFIVTDIILTNRKNPENNGLDFLIEDSLFPIKSFINTVEKGSELTIPKDIVESIVNTIDAVVKNLSEQASTLILKEELEGKDNEIILSLAFNVFGPSLSDFYEEFLPKKAIENVDQEK